MICSWSSFSFGLFEKSDLKKEDDNFFKKGKKKFGLKVRLFRLP